MTLEFTEDNWENEVENSEVPVVADFWAEWCGPCRMVGPVIDELSGDFEGKAKVGKINVDSSQKIAMKYGIRNIPTVLFIKNGEVVDRQVGAVSKSSYAEKLEKLI